MLWFMILHLKKLLADATGGVAYSSSACSLGPFRWVVTVGGRCGGTGAGVRWWCGVGALVWLVRPRGSSRRWNADRAGVR